MLLKSSLPTFKKYSSLTILINILHYFINNRSAHFKERNKMFKKISIMTTIYVSLLAAQDHKVFMPSNAFALREVITSSAALESKIAPKAHLLDVITPTRDIQKIILGYLTWEGNNITLVDEKSPSITCLQFSPCKKYMAAGSSDGMIRIWDAKTYTCLKTKNMRELFELTSVAWSPDDKHCAATDMSSKLRIWDARTVDHIKSSEEYVPFGSSLCYSPCGKLLLHGSFHNTISVWDSNTLARLHTFTHIKTFITEGHVAHVVFSPCGNYLISAGTGLKIWPKQSVEIETADADEIEIAKPDRCKFIVKAMGCNIQ